MENRPTLYHGSPFIVDKPVYGLGNPQNDYGLGFYCTHEIELAREWACSEEAGGYANQYALDLAGLSIVNLSEGDYNILNWLAILLNNRTFRISNDVAAAGKAYLLENFLPDTAKVDVIIGYRADDSYFSFANAFLNNTLSLSQLNKALYYGKLGIQTMIKSKTAFARLEFIDSEIADRNIYYPKKTARDNEARTAYRKERELIQVTDAVYLVDILRERWNENDIRLQRNISG
jgi:hypothetical protein